MGDKGQGLGMFTGGVKIEKQAYQLAEGIVVSQLKTVFNDKFRADC
jgi:hypothetical protein